MGEYEKGVIDGLSKAKELADAVAEDHLEKFRASIYERMSGGWRLDRRNGAVEVSETLTKFIEGLKNAQESSL